MRTWIRGGAVVVGAVAALTLTGCSGGSSSQGSAGKTLVVNDQFTLDTLDPARAFEFTDVMIAHQIYDTALTYNGSNISQLVPDLTTYTISSDNKVVTLKLDGAHKFPDGTSVSADDIVFSYQRMEGIQGNPSFLLDDPAGKPVVVAK